MKRNAKGRTVLAVLIGVALIGLLAGSLTLANGALGFSSCSGAVGYGWITPVLAGVIIGIVLWLLSGVTPKSKYNDDPIGEEREVFCASCGDAVMSDWRLCPSCGNRLDD